MLLPAASGLAYVVHTVCLCVSGTLGLGHAAYALHHHVLRDDGQLTCRNMKLARFNHGNSQTQGSLP